MSTEGAAGVEVLAAPSALLDACASEPPDVSEGAAHEASVAVAELSVVSVAVAEVSVVVPQVSVVVPEPSVLSVAAHEASVAMAEVSVVVPELSVVSVAAHEASVAVAELSVVSVAVAEVSAVVAELSVVSVAVAEVSVVVPELSVVFVTVAVLSVEAAEALSAGIEFEDETAPSEAGVGGSSARAVATNTDAQRTAASTAAVQPRNPGAPRRSQRGGWMLGTPTELPSISTLLTMAALPFGVSSIAPDRPGARSRRDWETRKATAAASPEVRSTSGRD